MERKFLSVAELLVTILNINQIFQRKRTQTIVHHFSVLYPVRRHCVILLSTIHSFVGVRLRHHKIYTIERDGGYIETDLQDSEVMSRNVGQRHRFPVQTQLQFELTTDGYNYNRMS